MTKMSDYRPITSSSDTEHYNVDQDAGYRADQPDRTTTVLTSPLCQMGTIQNLKLDHPSVARESVEW